VTLAGVASSFDVTAARKRFSALSGDFVFLDAPGGTQVPDEVGEAVARTYREASGNAGVPYATSRRIDAIIGESRAAAARFLGCDPEEVIFGGSMTALNFALSRAAGRGFAPGDEIVVTRLDHDANVAPWLELARDRDLVIREADVRDDTTLDLEDLAGLLGPRTRVVAFSWASNATGTIAPARAVCDLARQAGALSWVDAVQYAPHEPVSLREIGADVLLCSPYKFFGPHLGLACGRREVLESWRPYKVRPSASEPVGHRFETGTLPFELLAGLTAALRYLDDIGGLPAAAAWERRLGEQLLAGLPPSARQHGLPGMAGRVPTFLLSFPGIPALRLEGQLASRGFGVWGGTHYYALGLHERLGWGEALRVGLAHYNTPDEIDRFCAALGELTAHPGAGDAA
jgi:cysteine desulfurase family protein (TIGR01976 family)